MRMLSLTLLATAIAQTAHAGLVGTVLATPAPLPAPLGGATLADTPLAMVLAPLETQLPAPIGGNSAPSAPSPLPSASLDALVAALNEGAELIPQAQPGAFPAAAEIVLGALQSGGGSADPMTELNQGLTFASTQFEAGATSTETVVRAFATSQQTLLSNGAAQLVSAADGGTQTMLVTVNEAANVIKAGASQVAPAEDALGQPSNIGLLGGNVAAISHVVTRQVSQGATVFFRNAERFVTTFSALPDDPQQGVSTVPALFAALGDDLSTYAGSKATELQGAISYESTQARLQKAAETRNPALLSGGGNSLNRDFQNTLSSYGLRTPTFNTGPLPAP